VDTRKQKKQLTKLSEDFKKFLSAEFTDEKAWDKFLLEFKKSSLSLSDKISCLKRVRKPINFNMHSGSRYIRLMCILLEECSDLNELTNLVLPEYLEFTCEPGVTAKHRENFIVQLADQFFKEDVDAVTFSSIVNFTHNNRTMMSEFAEVLKYNKKFNKNFCINFFTLVDKFIQYDNVSFDAGILIRVLVSYFYDASSSSSPDLFYHHIWGYRGTINNHLFLSVLHGLFKKSAEARDIWYLLKAKIKAAKCLISDTSDVKVFFILSELLESLVPQGVEAKKVQSLIQKIKIKTKNKDNDFENLEFLSGIIQLYPQHFGAIVYPLAKKGLLPTSIIYTDPIRDAIMNHILALPGAEQRTTLNTIKSQQGPLSELFVERKRKFLHSSTVVLPDRWETKIDAALQQLESKRLAEPETKEMKPVYRPVDDFAKVFPPVPKEKPRFKSVKPKTEEGRPLLDR
jgi:hypothetical protein